MALNHSIDTDESTVPAALKRFMRRRIYELSGLLLLAMIVAASLALASWSPADPSFNHATDNKAANWLGYTGAVMADQFMQLLGLGVLTFIFIPCTWVIRFFRHESPENARQVVICWIGATLASSCLLGTMPVVGHWSLASGLGGNVGDVVTGGVFKILTIGLKTFVAHIIVITATIFATWWTVCRALNLSTRHVFGNARQMRKIPKTEPARTFSLALWWARLMKSIPKRAISPPKAIRSKNTGRGDDVIGRFAPLNLTKSHQSRIEPSLNDAATFGIPEYQPEMDDGGSQGFDDFAVMEDDVRVARPAKQQAMPKIKSNQPRFVLPSLDLLSEPKKAGRLPEFSPEFLADNARRLEGVLEDFGVRGQIINVRPGPVVTLYELEPAPGIKSSRVISLADDIARSMSAISARVAVVSGRNAIGIELPNPKRETVYLRELMQGDAFMKNNTTLSLALGKNIGGEPIFADLARMPHLLIAGTTGSGKSVGINTMILSLLYRLPPDKCKLIMIDPKMLELSVYEGIPHLLAPVVTDPRKAVVALKWAVREMEERYKKMSKTGVRNVDGYNAKLAAMVAKGEKMSRTVQTGFDPASGAPIFELENLDMQPMPYIVVIIDEMADLMMVAGKDIEGAVQRLAQMARAAGIHVVMATQRPSVDVITGTIKANFPTRISFQVTSKIDSRTILGEQGAEQLLGQGDMLYMAGGGRISRLHAPFVTDSEVESIVNHLKAQGAPEYLEAVTEEQDDDDYSTNTPAAGMEGGSGDELYDQAVAVVLRDKKVSTSYVQRRLQVGYNKAASLIERMEKEGLISAANATGKREILVPGDSARL